MRFAFPSLRKRLPLAVGVAATAALVVALSASANVSVLIIATDPFTNSTSQHATIVEPDTYSSGSTIVAYRSAAVPGGGGAAPALSQVLAPTWWWYPPADRNAAWLASCSISPKPRTSR